MLVLRGYIRAIPGRMELSIDLVSVLVLVLVLVLLYNTAVLWWTPFYRQRPGLQSEYYLLSSRQWGFDRFLENYEIDQGFDPGIWDPGGVKDAWSITKGPVIGESVGNKSKTPSSSKAATSGSSVGWCVQLLNCFLSHLSDDWFHFQTVAPSMRPVIRMRFISFQALKKALIQKSCWIHRRYRRQCKHQDISDIMRARNNKIQLLSLKIKHWLYTTAATHQYSCIQTASQK